MLPRLVFLASSAWVAFSAPLLPAAAAHGHGREHCPSQLCGSVNISFPFGIVPEDDAVTPCDALFQVRCRNNTPYLGYYQTEYNMQILTIFYDNASLLVAETPDDIVCYVPTGNTTSKFGSLFSISPLNQDLIFYNCSKPQSPGQGLVETKLINDHELRIETTQHI